MSGEGALSKLKWEEVVSILILFLRLTFGADVFTDVLLLSKRKMLQQ